MRTLTHATRRITAVLGIALLVTAVAAPFAFALTPISVTYDNPAGWAVELREPPEYPGYWLSIEQNVDIEDGAIAHRSSVFVNQTESTKYETLDEFLDAYDMPRAEQNLSGLEDFDDSSLSFEEQKTFSMTDNGTTEIGGKPAYFTTSRYETLMESFDGPVEAGQSTAYYVDLGDSGVIIYVSAMTRRGYFDQLDTQWAQADAIFRSMQFDWGDGSATGGTTTGGGLPWQPVAGGLGAVAAAAAAMAGAAAKTSAKSKTKQDPNQPIGYILNVSSDRLSVSPEQTQPLTVTVYQVMPNGQPVPAAANISLTAPPGASVQPASGSSPLSAIVWQTGEIPPGAQLLVQAATAGGSSQTAVAVVGSGELRLDVAFEPPDKRELIASGADHVTLVAIVTVPPGVAADPTVDLTLVRSSIEFSSASEWLDLSAPVSRGDGMAVSVEASQPDPDHPKDPPPTCIVHVKAQVGAKTLAESVSIAMARTPVLDAAPDEVAFAADSHATAEVRVWIDHAGGAQWDFTTAWREGSQPLAQVDLERTGSTMCTLTLTEDSAGKLDPSRPEDSATLRVLANCSGFAELERYVQVIVSQEGLFIDPIGRHPEDGTFRIKADGSGAPTEIDLRVYARDPATGELAPNITLAQEVLFEIAGEEGTAGRAGLKVGEYAAESAGVRQLNDPSATFRMSLARRLPTGGTVLPAAVRASVPGQELPAFTKEIRLGLLGVDTEPYSGEWELELGRCKRVIEEYVPAEYHERLMTLLSERSKTMGAEGLYQMRHRLWEFAHDQLVKEAHEHLDEAWWNEQIIDTLDWISWCGDIALGVASGSFVGTVGSLAIGLLKPILVSAIEAWVYNRSLEEWAYSQFGILVGVVEGCATDVDLLAKLTGEKKALAWAIFIAYYFAKELYNEPNHSVTQAMTNVGRQLRDEGLIIFLRRICGVKPGVHPGAEPPAAPKKGVRPGAPDAPPPTRGAKPGTPDASPPPKGAKPGAPDAKPAGGAKPGTPDAVPTKGAKPGAPDATPPKKGTAPEAPDAKKPKPETPETKKPDAPEKKPDAPDKKPEAPEKKPETDGKSKPDAGPRTPKSRADAMATDIKNKTAGGKKVDKATVEQILRDPDAMRELRKNYPEVWKDFHETRQKIYDAHDAKLKDWIKKNVPGAEGKDIDVESFGTKDGVDRDYRAGYVITDPATGTKTFIEIPKERWAGESQKIFAAETGGPTDPKGAAKWSKDHQQLATDQYHAESSVDMADQRRVWNPEGGPTGKDGKPTGAWEQTQVTPNVDMVKQGRATLLDPDGLGKTYETKVAESYHAGNPLDAFKQADKAVHSLEGVREGYAMQGYGIKELPPKIAEGMQAIKDVQSGKLDPAGAEARIREIGYPGGLPDFMERISSQFAGFKWARKA